MPSTRFSLGSRGSHAPLFLENPADKGIVVFIHGFMGSPRQFDKFAETVQQQGCSVAALLLPGHGGSAREFASSSFERWQSHVDSEVERYSRDYASIWLVGHSMGGLLAINAAVKHSASIRGLFLIACPFKVTTISTHAMKVRATQLFTLKRSPIKAAYIAGSSIELSPSLVWHLTRPTIELKKLMQAASDNLPNVRAPVMAVYSASDELTSIKSLDILKSGLTNAEYDHLLLADSLHAYYPEHELAMIEQALLKLIAGSG